MPPVETWWPACTGICNNALKGFRVARLQGFRVARLQGYKVSGLRGCRVVVKFGLSAVRGCFHSRHALFWVVAMSEKAGPLVFEDDGIIRGAKHGVKTPSCGRNGS